MTRDVLVNQLPGALMNPPTSRSRSPSGSSAICSHTRTGGVIWLSADALGASTWLSAGIAFVIGHVVRVLALYRAWEEPLAKEPKGVYVHDDRRPMLGRKLKGKCERELRSLGLVVEHKLQVDPKLKAADVANTTKG